MLRTRELDPEEQLGRLRAGCFLFATEILSDPNFEATVALVCQHSPEGSYGLVLNRPSHMPLSEIFNGMAQTAGQFRKVYIGGPVQGTELQVLNVTDEPVKDAIEVSRGVYLGGYWEELDWILRSDNRSLRLFLGYSGWGKGQLESEVRMGAWEVKKADARRILSSPDDPWVVDLEKFKRHFFRE